MSDWTYYAVYQTPYSTLDAPDNVLRQRPGARRQDAEVLSSAGWTATDLLSRIFVGRNDTDVTTITHEQAATFARKRSQRVSCSQSRQISRRSRKVFRCRAATGPEIRTTRFRRLRTSR
jgi:hypothetical protein